MVRMRFKGPALGFFKIGADGGRVTVAFNDYHGHEVEGCASISEAEGFVRNLQSAIESARLVRSVCAKCGPQGTKGYRIVKCCRGFCAVRAGICPHEL